MQVLLKIQRKILEGEYGFMGSSSCKGTRALLHATLCVQDSLNKL